MLLVEREGEGIPKRVIRVCGVWCWGPCHNSKRTRLQLNNNNNESDLKGIVIVDFVEKEREQQGE